MRSASTLSHDRVTRVRYVVAVAADTVFVVVVLLRFTVPLLIPKFPLPAILGALVLDAADQTIFQMVTDDPLPGYQSYDKALDIYYLAIAYISTMRMWRSPVAFNISRFLYLYRLVGVLLFELLDKRWLLLVFPNTFEYFFIVYEAIRTRWNPLRLSATALVGTAAFIWVVIKLPQEWWIHVAQLDFTDFMADHPYMWGVLGALVVIAALLIWKYRSRIPATDWPFTVRVDDHLPPIVVTDERTRIFDAVLVEKVVFMALVSVIFSQILPDVRSGTLGVAIGVSALVVANTLVTEFIYRRGHSWNSTASAVVATLAINVALVLLDSWLSPRRDAPTLVTLFFVLMLSLLVALFDRYRATRGASDLRTPAIAAWRAERTRKEAVS
jgi:hypothetical protein